MSHDWFHQHAACGDLPHGWSEKGNPCGVPGVSINDGIKKLREAL
jgi:hypothetical protein